MDGWVLWASLSKDIISIIERYAFKSMHRDAMKRNYVFEDIRGYRRIGNGIKFVNSENLCHRDGDNPAIIWSYGDKYWCKKGKLHREHDRPAVINSDGDKFWYKKGTLHREDGPAIIYCDGRKCYWIDGKRIK